MKLHRLTAPSLAIALAFTLAACGTNDSQPANTQATTPATAQPTDAAELNAADVAFAQGMIAHHEQAIEMAEIALDPTVGASPEVVDLATRIKGAQDPEVQMMTAWLTAAGQPLMMDAMDGHDMSSMDGMMTAAQLDAMEASTGAEFDTTWLEMMIAHHQGAISQSETVKSSGSNAEVLALADQIITAQRAEITEMQALLQG